MTPRDFHSTQAPALIEEAERRAWRAQFLASVVFSISLLICGLVLLGWAFAPFAQTLPGGWHVMQAGTALALLLIAVELKLRPSQDSRAASIGIAAGALAFAVVAVCRINAEFLGGADSIATVLSSTSVAPELMPGMSRQSGLMLIALLFAGLIPARAQGWLGSVLDAATIALGGVVFGLLVAYIFEAESLLGESDVHRVSVHTLFCIAGLTIILLQRRAPFGALSVFVGPGIGSRVARAMLPISITAAGVAIFTGALTLRSGALDIAHASALSFTLLVAVLSVLVLVLAKKANQLGEALRRSSIQDELTGLLNRRGFRFVAEPALAGARRVKERVWVCFIDLDGLKIVNDTYGHDAGSEMIREAADLLMRVFRTDDIVARVGGDEFVALCCRAAPDAGVLRQRLDAALNEYNAGPEVQHPLSFSVGVAYSTGSSSATLEALVTEADHAMYDDKRLRRARREDSEDNVVVYPFPRQASGDR